jgi:hypothetical protein
MLEKGIGAEQVVPQPAPCMSVPFSKGIVTEVEMMIGHARRLCELPAKREALQAVAN